MRHSPRLVLAVAGLLVACHKEEVAPSPTAAAATASATETSTPASPPQPTAAAQPAPTHAAPSSPEKTLSHSKLGFSLTYPDVLTAKEEAKGVKLTSATIAKVEVDRSEKSKGPEEVALVVHVTVEDGSLVAVAKKTNPTFGAAFPKGTEASFKEDKDFAEKVTTALGAGYSFTMGSHGSNERDTFLPAKADKTFVVRCSYVGDAQNPKMSEASQLAVCDRVVSSLKP